VTSLHKRTKRAPEKGHGPGRRGKKGELCQVKRKILTKGKSFEEKSAKDDAINEREM